MIDILRDLYNLPPIEIKKLAGYDNVNYLVTTSNNIFIFKTYTYDKDLFDLVVAESELLDHLSKSNDNHYPKPIKTKNGEWTIIIDFDRRRTIIRLLSYLEGDFLAEVKHSPTLVKAFGVFLANTDLQLQGFNHYTIRARRYVWDIQHLDLIEPFIQDISEPHNRSIVEYFIQQYSEVVLPRLYELRKSIIHNDANDWNVLVNNGQITGLIDFGDVVYAPLVQEIAVAITYVIMGKKDPLQWAGYLLNGYHHHFELETMEIDLLYYFIAARLCISVCNSAHSKKLDPKNEYISISEEPAWELLNVWLSINPVKAKNKFRTAVGNPVEQADPVEKKIEKRHQFISPIVTLSYNKPIYMDRAAFQYMYDVYGNTYLDAYNNIPHVGHSHPKVVEAGQKQMAILNTNTRYVYDLLDEYAERLLSKFPSKLNKVFFVNSGSAASDLAIRLARHHTMHDNIMVMEHGYHGHTIAGIEVSDYKFSKKRGPGQKPWILKTPIPDTYRGKYKGEDAGQKYASEAMDLLHNFGKPVAAFIAEPIVGCGGQVPLAPGYLQHLYGAIRAQGAVCISDEVQTGFGRLGDYFWGFEAQGVIPDIVILGKPMGNGHPMGAVVTTDEIAQAFEEGVEFFSSFGGNPVSCAIGLAVLDVIEEERLQHHALEVGNHYKHLMNELKQDFSNVGDVRGSGLFLGFEIIDENGKEHTSLAGHIKNELRNRNILVSTDGPFDNVLKSKPPLCFTKADAEMVVENIYEILKIQ